MLSANNRERAFFVFQKIFILRIWKGDELAESHPVRSIDLFSFPESDVCNWKEK